MKDLLSWCISALLVIVGGSGVLWLFIVVGIVPHDVFDWVLLGCVSLIMGGVVILTVMRVIVTIMEGRQ